MVALAATAGSAAAAQSPPVAAATQAAVRILHLPVPARFRGLAANGDIVCGEAQTAPGRFTPFYAYRDEDRWTAHAAKDGRGLTAGLSCFDGEIAKGGPLPQCRGYDFDFYFAWDHFCR